MKKRIKLWPIMALIALGISLGSCATYNVVRTEIIPPLVSATVTAFPNLALALWEDFSGWIGGAVSMGEEIVGYSGPSDTVPE